VGVSNPSLAYMFDDAVLAFGVYIDGMRELKTKDGKRYLHSLDELLRDEDEAPTKRRTVDNAAAFKKLAGMAGVKVME
jgi:hypothetical protein